MKRSWWYRFSFLLLVVATSGLMLVPTVFNFSKDTDFPVKSKINLGLDLQGGLYMVLGIDFNKVYRDEIKGYGQRIIYFLEDEGIKANVGEVNRDDIEDPKVEIIVEDPTKVEAAHDKIKDSFRSVLRLTKEEGNKFEYGLLAPVKQDVKTQSVTKSIEVIRNRIDEFGVTEPEIISLGEDRIVVQLPGIKDIERAKELIGRTAKLEFKIVNDEVGPQALQAWVDKAEAQGIVYNKGELFSNYIDKLNTFLKDDIPQGSMIVFEKKVNNKGDILEKLPYLVESNSKLTGDELADARAQIDTQKNEPYVSMTFKSRGAKIFEDITGKNVGKRLAVILDGNLYTAPNIRQKIAGGNASITLGYGSFNQLLKEARDISLVLRAGALPVELEFQEQRVVGASLGQDSIEKAEIASLVGVAVIFLFILIYYKVSGLVAICTLVVNVLIVLACLIGLDATLTLPGIAGIALTVGMAIDANIIIYERIREEIRKGVGYFKAVEKGFSSAFWTILDANITTALAGLCLLNFGTGPIRGFAVTLLIGIVATIYSAYFVSKLVFELYMDKVEGSDLSI